MKGELHRGEDKLAIIRADGAQWWYRNGKHHRDDDRPAVINPDGFQSWWVNGELHRDGDLPAAIYTSQQHWYQHGEPHRLTEPAVQDVHESRNRWYLYGRRLTEEKYEASVKRLLAEQDIILIRSLPYEYPKNVFITLRNR